MDVKEGLALLNEMYEDRAWYENVGLDQYGRYVVYVGFMNMETMLDIVREFGGKQVMVHFVASKLATAGGFMNDADAANRLPAYVPITPTLVKLDQSILAETFASEPVEEDKSLRNLTDALDKLEKQCGTNILQDIFYEIHDAGNAVTNLSVRFPEVRKGLEKLYEQYGFDVVYEEMDG